METNFENIVPWNGANDTGKDVRLKLERNFKRIGLNFEEVLEKLEKKLSRVDDDKAAGLIQFLQGAVSKGLIKADAGLEVTGDFSLNSKAINDLIRYYDEERPVSTDTNIYSALMTDHRIEEELEELDDRYLRKDKEDFAHKHITFEEGITVYELAELMNLDVKNLATIAKAVVSILRSSRFVDGFAGEGYQIWQDIASGDWNLTIDRITVRKVMTIYELVIQKIRSVGGMVVVSAANGKVKSIDRIGNSYLFTFEDTNTFMENDLMRCQEFTGKDVKYYWVKVASVSGDSVIVPVSEFNGVVPAAGDECVLMGNTTNKRRQSLILISATEDGQPRFDCMNGVKTKTFEDCLKVRVGNLDGISDSRFPADMQPNGHGIYGNNCFLTGIFVLSNGKDVLTMFGILEGMIKAEISSVRNEINSKDNYLSNAAFADNLLKWTGSNNIRVFNVSDKLLYFNNNFYANKEAFANIVNEGGKNVLRLKNSHILQVNPDYSKHPEFDLHPQMDEEDNPVLDPEGNQISLLRPRMFYISFKCLVKRQGTLRVYFVGEDGTGFEEYNAISHSETLQRTDEFNTVEIAGKWSGTGDMYLSFSGDMYLYSLALTDNPLADLEEKFTARFEMTDKKIQTNLDEIKKTAKTLEEYHSEFLLTARNLEIKFAEDLSESEIHITEAYKSYVNLTARDLAIRFDAGIDNSEKKITEDYTAAINLSAQGLRTDFSHDLTDMEGGITSAYKSSVELSAKALRGEFSQADTNLKNGITKDYTAAINLSAQGLITDFNSSIGDLNGRVVNHTGSFHVTSSKIEAMVSATDSINRTISSAGWITQASGNIWWASKSTEKTASDAVQAAINAATAAGNAMSRANSAFDKADATATALVQTNSNISAIAGRFNADGTLKEGAGWMTTADANTSWVKKNGIVSAINQTAESVTIDASKINFNGLVTANKTFRINLDGSMEASGGKIGDFVIQGGDLRASNGKYEVTLGPQGISMTDSIDTLLNIYSDIFNVSSNKVTHIFLRGAMADESNVLTLNSNTGLSMSVNGRTRMSLGIGGLFFYNESGKEIKRYPAY